MKLNEKIKIVKPDEWEIFKKFLSRSKTIQGKEARDLIYLPYWFVKVELPDLLNNGDFEEMIFRCFESKLSKKKLQKLQINEALSFVMWVFDEIKKIQALEKNYLSSPPKMDLINAGVNRLDELGETNVIDALAGGDVLKWDKVKKLPYHVIFDKQRKSLLESQIQSSLEEIQVEKRKQKTLK